jgi:hypothetical protein
MEAALEQYGATFMPPPDTAYSLLDVREINGRPRSWSVVMPLWTVEEGRSDLSIELTLVDREGSLDVELDNIRVR